MSRDIYDSLLDEAFVYRLAETGSAFLPKGENFPNASLFRPSSMDEKESATSGRPPGVSVWDRQLTCVNDASRIRYSPKEPPEGIRAFGLTVQRIREIAREREHHLAVVAVPLSPSLGEGANGHAHIEGLKRERGQSRNMMKGLRADLIHACVEVL